MKIINLFQSKINPYNSIDELPIYNWHKINETNELSWLLRQRIKINDYQAKILLSIWEKIISEFIDTFGIPEKMREILELRREILVLKCQMQLEKNRIIENFIRIAEFKLKQLLEEEKAQNVGKAKVYVEKYLGFRLNEKEVSVKEFYEYIEALKEQTNKNIVSNVE